MLNRIKSLFEKSSGAEAGQSKAGFSEKEIAAAALMVEAAHLDGNLEEAERAAIKDIVIRSFSLDGEEADDLIAAAKAHHEESSQLLYFTRTIKEHSSPEERIELIEMLWEVAYADGVLHAYEANLLRRIAGLIYVSDKDRGEARKRVLDRLGIVDAKH